MAIALWKRIEKSRPYWKLKLLVKRLTGKELWLRRELRIETHELGGWRFHPRGLDSSSIVYSLGIGDDIDFDRALIERCGCTVLAFDPTPATLRWLAQQDMPPQFHFHPWAITASDGSLKFYPRVRPDGTLSDVMYTLVPEDAARAHGTEVQAYSLESAMARLGHRAIDILKVDIEGAEYDVIDSVTTLDEPPRQLLVEFHHRFANIGKARTEEAIAKLNAAGYKIFAISETGREVSFLHDP